jgi:predicted dinucleotide-utilizing enzyme
VQRSVAMARNLAQLSRQESLRKKPRIILLSTGAVHALDVIRTLRAEGNLSVIGLVPNNYATFLEDIAKASK